MPKSCTTLPKHKDNIEHGGEGLATNLWSQPFLEGGAGFCPSTVWHRCSLCQKETNYKRIWAKSLLWRPATSKNKRQTHKSTSDRQHDDQSVHWKIAKKAPRIKEMEDNRANLIVSCRLLRSRSTVVFFRMPDPMGLFVVLDLMFRCLYNNVFMSTSCVYIYTERSMYRLLWLNFDLFWMHIGYCSTYMVCLVYIIWCACIAFVWWFCVLWRVFLSAALQTTVGESQRPHKTRPCRAWDTCIFQQHDYSSGFQVQMEPSSDHLSLSLRRC